MTDLEKKEALEKLEALMKAVPVGNWPVRDLADIVKHLILDVKTVDIGQVSDKRSTRK